MDIDITIKNYRCFSDTHPARICLRPGFTALVGVNNSGKSSLLKFFYEFRKLFEELGRDDPGEYLAALKSTRWGFGLPPSISDVNEIFCNSNTRDIEIEVRVLAPRTSPLPVPDRLVITIPRGTRGYAVRLSVPGFQVVPSEISQLNPSRIRVANAGAIVDLSTFNEAFRIMARTFYIGPFRNAINIGSNDDYFDIRVGQAFVQGWRNWKNGPVRKDNESAYKLTQDIRSIFDFRELEINPSPDDRTLQVFTNGKSYTLSELGSGLTQFILVLANAAIRRPSYILIDEPELNLHPTLQLDFLTTLASYSESGIVFGTHSIGLARASSDRLYALRKQAEGECHLSDFEGLNSLAEFLGEMSFSGYNELGFNKVLLVEGSTEVRTIQQFLRRRKIDHQIVLLPLGGSQMINADRELELGEVKRISDDVLALIDSERDSAEGEPDGPRQAFVESCRRVGVECHVLDRRATENYFPDHAVKRVKGEKHHALDPYQKLSEVDPAWSKSDNWRIARAMTREDLQGTDLGRFLDSLEGG